MRVPEEVGKEIQKKKVFVEITTENFLNLIKKKKEKVYTFKKPANSK